MLLALRGRLFLKNMCFWAFLFFEFCLEFLFFGSKLTIWGHFWIKMTTKIWPIGKLNHRGGLTTGVQLILVTPVIIYSTTSINPL